MTQLWKLNGYCPECRRSYSVVESPKVKVIELHHAYYTRMEKENRPVAQCKDCGAYFESFVIKAVYARPVKAI